MTDFDVAIIGGGMAGASIAAELAAHMSVIIVEAEHLPGYHSTGRSAAFWSETYGGPLVQPLTTASGQFLAQPQRDFSKSGFLSPRGAVHLGRIADDQALTSLIEQFAGSAITLDRMNQNQLRSHVPGLNADWCRSAWEPDCSDIDVAALHAAYLGHAKRHGAQLRCNMRVKGLKHHDGEWTISCANSEVRASNIVNAAGAWADDLAVLGGIRPIGIIPYRRTIARIRVGADVPSTLPLVIDINEGFYFKPDTGGRIWLSPHDETPTVACDAAPEELEIAIAIDRFEKAMTWPVLAVEHSWAGLRSFAPDRLPVIGADPANPSFYWCAGQGGFGIQTAPAIAKLLAAQILDSEPDQGVMGIDPAQYAPDRFG